MLSSIPQNAQEAAYASFALFTALIDRLVLNHVLSDGDVQAIFDATTIGLEAAPNDASSRAASFIRNVMRREE
jgi:hypothetical protein